jgi:mannan endo-1,4-beta-mannosidase
MGVYFSLFSLLLKTTAMKILFIAIALSLGINTMAQNKPVNSNATPEAQKLLQYLYSIKGKYTLAGQHNYSPNFNQYMDTVYSITGKYPAVWGADFIMQGTNDLGEAIVKEAIKKWNDGYIVTLMWHSGRPVDDPPFGWKESIQGKLTEAQWKDLTQPGTELNQRWIKQVDVIAGYLKKLQDAHVPVLWRPYHEMNGVWFWWGNKKGPDGYQKLWKMLYDRFVNFHKLNNLLWVWNANAPRDIPFDEAFTYKDFYPGKEWVDVLATDVYHFDYEQKDYQELLDLAQGKIIALGECGELPKPEIIEMQPEFAWFMVWANWIKIDNTPRRVKDVYNLPRTLTHEKVQF